MIAIDKMFQLLTKLEPDTILLERTSNSPHGCVEWCRKGDGSSIDWPDRRLITGMQALKLLDTEPMTLPGSGEAAIRFKLSEKARRILQAREDKGPTHRTPYLGEYCWLVIHEYAGVKEAYPYLGASPPDLTKIIEVEEGNREGERFHVSCYRLNGYLRQDECLFSGSGEASILELEN
jgi:hypothetical protein